MIRVPTSVYEATNANILTVEVGTNCPQGGDAGHGGRTVLRLKNEGGTDMSVFVRSHGHEDIDLKAEEVMLTFGGDAECHTLIECLEYALKVLIAQNDANQKAKNIIEVD